MMEIRTKGVAKAKGFEMEWEMGWRKVCTFKGRLGHCQGRGSDYELGG